jgi:hypothetical protein
MNRAKMLLFAHGLSILDRLKYEIGWTVRLDDLVSPFLLVQPLR